MAFTFQGIGAGQKRTGTQALDYLNTTFGKPLDEAQRREAMGVIGYTDMTGGTEIGDADYNKLMQYAAQRSGGSYAPFRAPQGPPVAPPGTGQTGPPYPTEGPVWQQPFEAPTIEAAPTPVQRRYEAKPFEGPTWQDVESDPGYQWAKQQGEGAIMARAAGMGMARTGNTLRDLSRFNAGNATQYFGDAFNRKAQAYGIGADERRFGYNADVAQDQQQYAPQLLGWNARREANQRNAELNFDRSWQRELYGRDDAYRRWRAGQDDERYNRDDAFRRYQLEEQRRQFLAGLGQRSI